MSRYQVAYPIPRTDLRAWLAEAGWIITPECGYQLAGGDWYAWRRLEGVPACACGGQAPIITVRPVAEQAVWIELSVATVAGGEQWWRLQAEQVTADQVIDRLPMITRALSAAWFAVVESVT